MEENKYKEALERAKSAIKECGDNVGRIKMIESIFPELAESKEENIRKSILMMFKKALPDVFNRYGMYKNDAIAYMEKLKDIDKRLEDAYKTADEVQYKRGYGKGYVDGMADAKKKELEKQGEFPTTISVDKMVEEFERARIEANSICQIIETDAYRKGVVDTLSKILIKEEKPITIGSKKAEGKLGEMLAASKEPAESGEDKELTHSQLTKKSEQDGKKWIDEKVYWKEREELFEDGKQEVINNPMKYGLIKDENHIANDSKKVEPKVWSKEDEENYRNATTIISRQKLNAYSAEMMSYCNRCIDWLESIKERMN